MCFHSRSWQFYQESIRNKNPFIALKCDSYQNFINNKNGTSCDTETAFMGFIASKEIRGNFYLRTHRNVYRLSLGNESLHFKETKICYGENLPCKYEDEFIDQD